MAAPAVEGTDPAVGGTVDRAAVDTAALERHQVAE